MGNSKHAASCQLSNVDSFRPQAPTVRQAAQHLLDALDRLTAGEEVAGFAGWQNGLGEPAGDWVEEARHELRVVLAATPAATQILTGADFDPEAFERIWQSDAVQQAGRSLGWRGIAEAVWAAALEQVRVA